MQNGQVHREMRNMPADEERRCVVVWKAFDFFARDEKGIAAKKAPAAFAPGLFPITGFRRTITCPDPSLP
jgi:hypothetical protein